MLGVWVALWKMNNRNYITHHFANQGDRLSLPKVRHAVNAKYSTSPENKKYGYSRNEKLNLVKNS